MSFPEQEKEHYILSYYRAHLAMGSQLYPYPARHIWSSQTSREKNGVLKHSRCSNCRHMPATIQLEPQNLNNQAALQNRLNIILCINNNETYSEISYLITCPY